MFSNKIKPLALFFTFIVLLQFNVSAQKVGVVFSGGGAAGFAHIGVLKALEENHIPIDYVAGTSQGSIIAAMYASGFSAKEIEGMVKTDAYKNMASAAIEDKYAYYFKRQEPNPSMLKVKLSLDSTLRLRVPTNVMSPVSLDFGMMEFTSGPSAAANYNFDSLFIPFRCVAADIDLKEPVIFREGDLGEAVRASISYPFYIPPVVVDGKLLFDGGLYNNFPSDVMYSDFFPDFMIGSTVAANGSSPDEDNVFSQLKTMLMSKTNFNVPCEGGILIKPNTNVFIFDFSDPQPTIDSGYVATMREIEFIKQNIHRRTTAEELAQKRKAFRAKIPKIDFDKMYIDGLNKSQTEYAKNILKHKDHVRTLEEIKQGYFRLASDNKITYIYPKARYNKEAGHYDLFLKIKKEKDIIAYVGGNFSNRPISMGYLGVQYNYLSYFATEVSANAYFGKLYSSVQGKARFDFPFHTPFYVEPNITWNKFDYYTSSNAFLADVKPPYLKVNEQYFHTNLGFPTGKKARIVTGAGIAQINNNYYQTSNFLEKDTTDETDFNLFTANCSYEVNTLNRRQYANQGEYYNVSVRYVNGEETNTPGSTSLDTAISSNNHEWFIAKLKAERYFNRKGTLKIGLLGEAVYSNQSFFNNYTATILAAPAFQPTPETKTIFLENYRAHQYAAAGIKFVVNFRKNIELRAEGYIFQPIQEIKRNTSLKPVYGDVLKKQYYVGTGAIVWSTPAGPMSLSLNYYNEEKKPFSVLFHFGYIMFNKRALE
ncbi:MAG: patatin-like phospholipase family protein [Bacteroidia bacterium]